MELLDQFVALLDLRMMPAAFCAAVVVWVIGQIRVGGSPLQEHSLASGLVPLAATLLGVACAFVPGILDQGSTWGGKLLNGITAGLLATVILRAKVIMRIISQVTPDKKQGDSK